MYGLRRSAHHVINSLKGKQQGINSNINSTACFTCIQTRGFKKKAKTSAVVDGELSVTGKDKKLIEDYNRFLQLSEESKKIKPDLTEEELAAHEAIAKEFTRKSFQRHNELEKDLTDKIWLQSDAINALPQEMKIEAEKLDDTPPPADRPWPYMDTPPIEGFDHRKINSKGDDEEDDDEEA